MFLVFPFFHYSLLCNRHYGWVLNRDMACILLLILLFFSHGISVDFKERNLISNTVFMANERDDSLQSMSVRLNEKNNLYWSYVTRNFLKGKKLWGYITETYVKPKSTDKDYVAIIDTWEANNAKIISWINNYVKHSIGIQLAKFETTKEVCDHL